MKNIINRIMNLVERHIGDEYIKKIYAVSLLSMGVEGEEPMHIHVFGSHEVGKSSIQSMFLEIIPDEHKDVASDFSPRVLMYDTNLNENTFISINDKVFTDPVCQLLNQVCDSHSYRMGKVCAVTVGKERVNLVFPRHMIFWCNSNYSIPSYALKEVDPAAVESRFMVIEKKYSNEDKENIFIKRNNNIIANKEELESVRNILRELFKKPKIIACSEENRKIIWNESQKIGISSLRQIGRNLTICQVFALINNRNEVAKEDIESTFTLLKEQAYKTINSSETIETKTIEIIKNELLKENMFKSLSTEKKLLYSLKEIQNKIKTNITSTINIMKSENIIGYEVIKVGTNRIPIECYYLLEK